MGFTKINTLSLTELFVQQVENMILSGELRIGEKLPSSRELSVRMEVSRPVISSGFTELEKMGFVEVRPRQGVFVCDYRRKGTLETLVAIMRYNGGAMRKNEVRSLLEVRLSLECLCVEKVIDLATQRDIDILYDLVENIKETSDEYEAAERIFDFHHEMAIISGNNLLPLLYYSFRPESVHLWCISCKNDSIEELYTLKKNLFSAIKNRDKQDAVRQTESVMKKAIENLDKYGV